MSILYCTIPYFAAALARRNRTEFRDRPLILIGPQDRVFGTSAEAALCGIVPGMTVRTAQIRCPDAHLLEADVAQYRREYEVLLQSLEQTSPSVEPHGWGAAYVDLGDLARDRHKAVAICQECGRLARQELGPSLQPALGWNSTKFTAQAAARRTQPGRLMAIPTDREQEFLNPLPIWLLPLERGALQRLRFLGLRTLGQYAALPSAAVWQQFGKPGTLAHRYARGEDDRPVISRWRAPTLRASHTFDLALNDRARLLAVLTKIVHPMVVQLGEELKACGQLRLTVQFDDGSAQEKTRTFLYPTAEKDLIVRSLAQLLDGLHWTAPAVALEVTLEQIQDVVFEQLTLFPAKDEREQKLREVQRYLTARFGANRLRRAALLHPLAPLIEWRIGWESETPR